MGLAQGSPSLVLLDSRHPFPILLPCWAILGAASASIILLPYSPAPAPALPCCSYMWMTPMFLFVLPIFSLCNTNDCSWGTRDAHAVSAQPEVKARMDRNAREFRSRIV